MALYHDLLKGQGELHFKTDAEQLFEFSLNELISNHDYKLKEIQLDLHENNLDIPTTEYEDKFRHKGLKIFRVVAINLFDE